jgi:CubicO group peptidase (beta-lactamase class C family)
MMCAPVDNPAAYRGQVSPPVRWRTDEHLPFLGGMFASVRTGFGPEPKLPHETSSSLKVSARHRRGLPRPAALLLALLVAACGGGGDSAPAVAPAVSCSVSRFDSLQTLEAQMSAALSQAVSEVPFSFAVERQDGRRFTFNRGSSTLQTSYESKSASKLVTAVMILRLVEQGYLALADRPQDRIPAWPIASGITLAQLLSLTSGLTISPPCLNDGSAGFEACVINIASANALNGNIPGQAFFYSETHLQVAGLMAVRARGGASWQALVTEFKAQTGLFPSSTYDFPSQSNPALGGGMHITGEDYMGFLRALKNGSLLNAASMGQLLADRTASIPIVYSPIFSGIDGGAGLGEDWHYGFGLWHECRSAAFNCTPATRVSSPGALGTYPFWDRIKGYTGIVVRAGEFGTTNTGILIERSVRAMTEAWADC